MMLIVKIVIMMMMIIKTAIESIHMNGEILNYGIFQLQLQVHPRFS